MNDPGGISVGEVGGVVAGIVTVATTAGAGIAWLFRWGEKREESRSAKLQKWHEELEAREARMDAERAGDIAALRVDIAKLRREHGALHNAQQLLASALRALDPNNPALRMADDLLRQAFAVDPVTPPDMVATLGRIDPA
ncbi:hypothetical protein SAMN06295912_108108 [Sphingomonas laterariae]|uniref:Uncharacterized protein n=1 Tax=Edaphosphingomonas laterariae TaxID=861865 RepID=A0A239F7V4_9SPHN|nr:hypothetical protein [Sphingomonas laterariae]SNS52976.1 hypothetical protein SAMN06295912_108108 [Sphingomonas laterariae]